MANYLYKTKITKDMLSNEACKLSYLKTLLNTSKELDIGIREKYPISFFGNEDEDIKIKGVKSLINAFDTIDSEKMDIISQYKDIKYVRINNQSQLVLNFKCDDDEVIEAHSIYDFYNDFLEEGFQISKYVTYCIKNNYLDIIEKNLDWLLSRNEDKEAKQYRLLMDKDDTWGVRGVTSNIYKNYDNSIVLYLSLLSLHKYSIQKDKKYHIDFSYITDSSLFVFFEQDKPIFLPDVGEVYLGLAISNGEIRNKKFNAEMRYRIVNTQKGVSFSAIFNNPVFSIMHNMNVLTIEKQLEKLFKLDELEENMLKFIQNINSSENLSEDTIYFLITNLLEKLKGCSDISKKTAEEFKKIEISNMIKETVTLIDFLGKLSMISTDIDEQIFIERIFHKVIYDLQSRKNS